MMLETEISAFDDISLYFQKLFQALYALAVAITNIWKAFLNRIRTKTIGKLTSPIISRSQSYHPPNSSNHHGATLPAYADTCDPNTKLHPNIVYADYAGAPPYSISAVKSATDDLLHQLYSNPHTSSGVGAHSACLHPSCASRASPHSPIDRLRHLTLQLCNTDSSQYVCILTSGATAALKLVADSFCWSSDDRFRGSRQDDSTTRDTSPSSVFIHLSDNHTSVLGIREVATAYGAHSGCLPSAAFIHHMREFSHIKNNNHNNKNNNSNNDCKERNASDGYNNGTMPRTMTEQSTTPTVLFAYPLESNFHGVRYPQLDGTMLASLFSINNRTLWNSIQWHNCGNQNDRPRIHRPLPFPFCQDGNKQQDEQQQQQQVQYRVLLDATKACSTDPPDLSTHPADFVVLSYYKMFGYPTGLGALLVRRDAVEQALSNKRYFGGGTVLSSSAHERFHVLRPNESGFEDGTLPFLSIPAAVRGLEAWMARGGPRAARKEAHAAADYFRRGLASLTHLHGNGCHVAVIYGSLLPVESPQNGPTVTFNLKDANGAWIGHASVARIASLEGIILRTGVMCNPGACAESLGISPSQIKEWFEVRGHVCWDDQDVIQGHPTGAVRVSFGWGSTVNDAQAILNCIKRHFVVDGETTEQKERCTIFPKKIRISYRISQLLVYPIKSARPINSPASWPIDPYTGGLLYDRHWAVVDAQGEVLNLKKCRQLGGLRPTLDLDKGIMRLQHAAMAENKVSVDMGLSTDNEQLEKNKVVHAWLSQALDRPCRLVAADFRKKRASYPSQLRDEHRACDRSVNKKKMFTNEAQYLVVTKESLMSLYHAHVESLHETTQQESLQAFTERFRPNLVIERVEKKGSNGKNVDDSVSFLCGQEEKWNTVQIVEDHEDGNTNEDALVVAELRVHSPCQRCQMICISTREEDDDEENRTLSPSSSEPLLLTLAKERKNDGKNRFCFGLLLNNKKVDDGQDCNEHHVTNPNPKQVALGMRLVCF